MFSIASVLGYEETYTQGNEAFLAQSFCSLKIFSMQIILILILGSFYYMYFNWQLRGSIDFFPNFV